MKKIKKIFAVLLSLAMIMGMSVTSFAAEGKTPSSEDKSTITVNNVEKGATVTAYRVVEPTYDGGFTGYSAVAGTNIKDAVKPTSTEIGEIARNLKNLNLESVVLSGSDTTYSANVGAGYWMVIVTNTTSKNVYNPMLLGVYYSVSGSENDTIGGNVNAEDNWSLNGEDGYAKKAEPTIDKTIIGSEGVEKGDDVAIGSKVSYSIVSDIPTYSEEYTSVQYVITDTLSKGLTNSKDATVRSGETNLLETKDAEIKYDGQIMTITFTSDFILKNGGEQVFVEYSATLNSEAGINFDPNTNTAELTYSNNPDTNVDPVKKDSKTYHYTFGINAMLNGTSGTGTEETSEIIKVDQNGKVISTVTNINKENTTVTEVLKGATFTLTNSDGTQSYEATTDINGKLKFTGLDAGTYSLVETFAPDGFTIDKTVHEVEITASYNEDGTLKSYSIVIDGKATSTYEATYENGEITNIQKTTTKTEIKNTSISALPSTGGIGTTIFTIGGCLIMIVAAGLFFANRKKSNK